MNELQKKIREDAEELLQKMFGASRDAVSQVAEGTGVTVDQLLKLALGGRTESIHKKAISALATKREREMLALYQKAEKAGMVPDLKAVGSTKGG